MRDFMPHSLGHSVGLDNHDVGNLDIIQENMILAIEPGIYFYDDIDFTYINKKLFTRLKKYGGVRLEDTVKVNKIGVTILSNIPKEISAIERICNL